MTNRKPDERKGKVLLIDASAMSTLMKKNLGKKRREFIARIATGDHDCIVMPHSSFNLIGNHKDVVNNYINEQVAELEAARALTDASDTRAVGF